MKIYKKILLNLGSAFATMILVYGGYTIYAAANENFAFESPALGFLTVKNMYHAEMNNYFNEKLEKLNEILEKDNFTEDKNFQAPATEAECDQENVSSYCVSMGATDRYVSYVRTLNGVKGYLPSVPGLSPTAGYLLSADERRKADVDAEIQKAQEIMDAAISVYNEFRLAYPMHKEYRKVINNLIKYKLALREIHQEVVSFPSKFHDATSDQCE